MASREKREKTARWRERRLLGPMLVRLPCKPGNGTLGMRVAQRAALAVPERRAPRPLTPATQEFPLSTYIRCPTSTTAALAKTVQWLASTARSGRRETVV